MSVEFVSYTGCFAHLCSGTLTLRIDGKEVVFDNNPLTSGGSCWFDDDWNEHVNCGEWSVEVPNEYKHLEKEITECVNDSVPWDISIIFYNYVEIVMIVNYHLNLNHM